MATASREAKLPGLEDYGFARSCRAPCSIKWNDVCRGRHVHERLCENQVLEFVYRVYCAINPPVYQLGGGP